MSMFQNHVSRKSGLAMALLASWMLTGCGATEPGMEDVPEQSEAAGMIIEPGQHHMLEAGEDLCDSAEITQEQAIRLEEEFQRLRVVRAARAAGSVTIPVYFHVIRQGTELYNGSLSPSHITAQMTVLNNAFAASPYRFQLAGVDYTTNPLWFRLHKGGAHEAAMKAELREGGAGALNIFTVAPQDGTLGWTTYPWEYNRRPGMDGVVVSYASMPGVGQSIYNRGASAVHMAAHWFGVLHTYEAGCTGGDGVADTASQATPSYGCPVGRDTCPGGGADPINNYMDATDDSCKTGFTAGQFARMDTIGATYRR